MEKYFIVTKDASLHDDYFAYKNNDRDISVIAKEFMEQYGIEAKQYARSSGSFYISATQNDYEKFKPMFKKDKINGLYEFKKNSEIGKAWIELLKSKDLKVLHKPFIAFEFSKFNGGKYSTRLFDIDGVVYLSFDCGYEVDTPDGFKEIKASEFFKIIEDYEEKLKR